MFDVRFSALNLQPCFIISNRHALFSKKDLTYQDLTDNPVGKDAIRYIEIDNMPSLFGFVVAYPSDSSNPYLSRFIKCCKQIGLQS